MPTDLYQCLCQHHRLNSELCLSLHSTHHLSWDLTGVLPRPFYFLLESHLFHRSMCALHAQNKIDFPLLSLIVFDCCICFLNICFLFSYHSKFLILFYYLPLLEFAIQFLSPKSYLQILPFFLRLFTFATIFSQSRLSQYQSIQLVKANLFYIYHTS